MTIALCLVVFATGCRRDLYVLPDPPPAESWERVELDPSIEQRQFGERYVEARRVVIAFADAIRGERWADAWSMLSMETRLLLDNSTGGRGEAAFEDGRIRSDGAWYAFDPVDVFLIPNLTRFEDSVAGETENETTRRHELFVFDAEEQFRRVVVIREGDQWLIHSPRWPRERLRPIPPPEASPDP